jgi:hypothetical protein
MHGYTGTIRRANTQGTSVLPCLRTAVLTRCNCSTAWAGSVGSSTAANVRSY